MTLSLLKREWIVILFVTTGTISSCVDTRKSTYFNDLGDGTIKANTPVPETIIRKHDILSIHVTSLNEEATKIFNTPNVAGNAAAGATISGYLVSTDGTIQFPVLGTIKAEGLTKNQLKEIITKKLEESGQLKGAIVSIRLMNFRITVLGEVKNPAVLNIPSEKISLLEALGLAGDLTIYAKRDNVLVIREEGGEKIIKRINLNTTELLSSPYYYLKSEDIVYVEPNKVRVATAGRGAQWVPVAISALSFAAILVDRVSKN